MGGGRSYRSAYYGIRRKLEISQDAIYNTGEVYGVRLVRKHPPAVSVVNAKDWAEKFPGNENAVGIYYPGLDTFFIKRKYFAGRSTQNVTTHELLHGYSGKHLSKGPDKISGYIEEGVVEYLTQATRIHGYKGQRKVYAGGYKTYSEQVDFIKDLMGILGRKKVLRIWKEGLNKVHVTPTLKEARIQEKLMNQKAARTDESSDWWKWNNQLVRIDKLEKENKGYKRLARALSKKGYKHTAKLIRSYDSGEDLPAGKARQTVYDDLFELTSKDPTMFVPQPLEPGSPNND